VVLNDRPNMSAPMRFRLVRYSIADPAQRKALLTRGFYGGDVADDPESTLHEGLPREIAARFGVAAKDVRLISGF